MKERLLFLGMLIPLLSMAQSWKEQSSKVNYDLLSVDCYDSESVIATAQSRILYTTDGGKKWEPKNVSGYWHDVAFETKQVAYVVGGFNSYAMKKTTNGGNSWNDISMSNPPTNTVTNICFAEGWGFAVGNDGIFLKYNGTKWNNVGMSLPGRSSKFLESCYFIDKDTGFVVGDEDNGNDYEHIYPYIHSTVNGGSSWSHNIINLSTINGYGGRLVKIAFSKRNPNYGCAVGSYQKEKGGNMYGLLCITKNKGTNWTVYPFDATSWLYSVAFSDEKTVYAVGSNGTIIKKDITSPANWTQETSNTTSTLYDICFADANNGWAVGENGVILKYGQGNGNSDDLTSCESCSNKLNSTRIIPGNKIKGVARYTYFEWEHEAGRGITKYILKIFDEGNNIKITRTFEVNNPSEIANRIINYQLGNGEALEYNKDYKWKVTAYDAESNATACFESTFSTMQKPDVESDGYGETFEHLHNVVVFNNAHRGASGDFQCVEFVNRYYRQIYNLSISAGGKAKNYYEKLHNEGFKHYSNGNTTIKPQIGDIIVFNNGNDGHAAIVNKVSANTVTVTQQNYFYEGQPKENLLNEHMNFDLKFNSVNNLIFGDKGLSAHCTGWIRAEPVLKSPEDGELVGIEQFIPLNFEWEKHDNIESYTLYISQLNPLSKCYENICTVSNITNNNFYNKSVLLPHFNTGAVCKWRIEVKFKNNSGFLQSKAQYFTVLSDNSTITGSSGKILIKSEQSTKMNIKAIGSILSNAFVYRQLNDEWLKYGNTDENGILSMNMKPVLQLNDMLKITASGYEDLLVKVSQNILETAKIDVPMVRKTTPTNLIVNPSVAVISNANSSNISVKINGENITGYSIFDNEDESVQQFVYPDNKEITCTLKNAGINYLTFALYNNVDTVYIDKLVTNVSSSVNTYNVTVNPNQHHVKVYIDGYFGKDLSDIETLTLMEGEHELTFIQTGYKDSTVYVTEATTINLALQPIRSELLQTIIPQPNIPTYAGNGITVMSSGNNDFIVSKSNLDYSALGLNKLSETTEVTKATPNNDKISIFVALKPEKEIVTDNMYLLHIVNGQYFKIFTEHFGDSIDFDKFSDKLTCKNIYKQRENFVLAEKKAPVINTDLSFIINNPQLVIPLNYIASDPDKIDDITFQIKSISNDNYDVNIYEGYLNIVQKEKTGDLNIELIVTHDNINRNVMVSVINNNVSSIQVKEIDTNITLYPNPADDKVFLKHDASNIYIDKIHIFDIQGKLISALTHFNSSNIEISLPTSGNYFVSIFTNKGVITKNIIRK
jgi:photosystem II stability/assembly factor-like uncharacterized protein/surface antigen